MKKNQRSLYIHTGTIDRKSTDKQIVFWLCNQPHRLMENSLRKTYKKEKNLSMQINFAGAVYQWLILKYKMKVHFVKQIKAKYRCKIGECRKHHHSLLVETKQPDKRRPQEK